ncbi:MAG: hypothetical protein U1F98_12965 [Verrucomicrobiota bacterium]
MSGTQTQAWELKMGTNIPPVDFHGFVSQGLLYSTTYNYLADNTTRGSLEFFDAGLNFSMNPFPRTRIAAQGFMYDVGNVGQYDPFLDYALLEYTFGDYLGARGGKVRRPSGIYNQIQDLDVAYPWVLLPQGMYDVRWRDFSCSLNGGELFGEVPLKKAGSFSYEPYAGIINMKDNGGVARFIENGLPPAPIGSLDSIDSATIFGTQFWYNTPLEGLRAGASFGYMENFGYTTTIVPPYGPGQIHSSGNIFFQQYSLEYLWRAWTFQVEYYTYNFTGHNYVGGVQVGDTGNVPETWYVAVGYRFNKYVEAGSYYTQYYANMHNRDGSGTSTPSDSFQNDLALACALHPTDWSIFKVEGHILHGTALLQDDAANPVRGSGGWFMLAVKATLYF